MNNTVIIILIVSSLISGSFQAPQLWLPNNPLMDPNAGIYLGGPLIDNMNGGSPYGLNAGLMDPQYGYPGSGNPLGMVDIYASSNKGNKCGADQVKTKNLAGKLVCIDVHSGDTIDNFS